MPRHSRIRWGPRAQGEGAVWGFFGICVPIGLNGQNDVLFAEKCI